MERNFYTLEALAEELDINIQTLRRYIRERKIEASNIGKKIIIKKENVEKFIDSNVITEEQLKANKRATKKKLNKNK